MPIKQKKYRMNLNYALKVRKDLDKLLDVGFIYPIETTQWLSPLVIIPKKNGKLQICVDYHKLNAQTKKDPFPLPFLDLVLDYVARHEMYSLLWMIIAILTKLKWLRKIRGKKIILE
jgi:hypothetical protein